MKVVTVLYPGGSAAEDPEVLGCAENALGLRESLEEEGHELVSTTEREGEGLLEHLRGADVLITSSCRTRSATSRRS
jgi:formate dehydrogenase